MARLRIQRTNWPRHSIVLTDTPRPNCWACHGHGGWERDFNQWPDGWEPCPCWDDEHYWILLPLPDPATSSPSTSRGDL